MWPGRRWNSSSTSRSPTYGAISARYSCAISVAAWFTRFFQAMLVAALVGAQRGEAVADRHQIARAQQRVPAHVLERVFFLAGVGVGHAGTAEKGLERVRAGATRLHHAVGLHEADIVDEDLAQALGRIHDVDRAAAVLLRHRGALRQPRVRLLADRREHLQVVVDAAQLVGHLDQPELREIPDVGQELTGHAWVHRQVFDVLVEVLVDAVDEDRDRRLEAGAAAARGDRRCRSRSAADRWA